MSTPMEDMIAMSRGAQRGRAALAEDSPMEAPVSGFNRHMSLMAPATREMVLKSRTLDIEKFAESRQLNTSAVLHIAEAAMRLGRVPDLRQYGFSGDDAKAIKQFIAGDVLNLAIEQLDAMDTINEAMTDREASTIVRALAAAGANVLLKKNEDRTPGYTKALNCLKAGDLLTIRNMLGENLVSFGAAKALVCAMNAAPKKTREEIQAEATNTAGIASYMSLASNMAHARPRTMVNAERATRIEDEKTAMKIGPRLGASPFETDVLTLDGIASKYQEAQAEANAAMEAADDIESPTAVAPKGEKVKSANTGAKKLRSPGEYQKGQFHPGSHGTAEDEAAEEREIFEQCDLDEAQVRLVKKGTGHFHAVHKKTGKKIGDVKKDGKKWHAKGHSPGPSGRTHDHGSSFKSPKHGAKYLSGAWDEQVGAASLRGSEEALAEERPATVKKSTWKKMDKSAKSMTKALDKGGMFGQTAAERVKVLQHRQKSSPGRAGRQSTFRALKGK